MGGEFLTGELPASGFKADKTVLFFQELGELKVGFCYVLARLFQECELYQILHHWRYHLHIEQTLV